MLVVQWTFHTRSHHAGQVAEWFKSWADFGFPDPPHGWRLYRVGTFSPRNVVVSEWEFESLSEFDAWKQELLSSPQWGEATGPLFELDEGGGCELWSMEVLK
jgi:hypothetical protein